MNASLLAQLDLSTRQIRVTILDRTTEWTLTSEQNQALLGIVWPTGGAASSASPMPLTPSPLPQMAIPLTVQTPVSQSLYSNGGQLPQLRQRVVEAVRTYKLRGHAVDHVVAVVHELQALTGSDSVSEYEAEGAFDDVFHGTSSFRSGVTHGVREGWLIRPGNGRLATTHKARKLLKRRVTRRSVPQEEAPLTLEPPVLTFRTELGTRIGQMGGSFENFVSTKGLMARNNAERIAHFVYFLAKNLGQGVFDEHDIFTLYTLAQIDHPLFLRTNIDNHRRMFDTYVKAPNKKYAPTNVLFEAVEQGKLLSKPKK